MANLKKKKKRTGKGTQYLVPYHQGFHTNSKMCFIFFFKKFHLWGKVEVQREG